MKKPVIIFPLLRWDSDLIHRDQMLAKEFAKAGHEIFFIDRNTRQPWKVFLGGGISKKSGVNIVSTYTLPYFQGKASLIYWINNRLLVWQLRKIKSVFSQENILFVSNPDWAFVAEKLNSDKSRLIYDISDDYVALAKNNKWAKVVADSEKKLSGLADKFVLTTTELLGKIDANKPHTIVTNGVDLDGFVDAKPVIDRGHYSKVVGFIGGIYEWVDLKLVGQAAKVYPEALFVFIGPTNRSKELKQLEHLNNFRYLGIASKSRVADYFASLDVGLLPFVSEGEYPRLKTVNSGKIFQYFFFGYPVVATNLAQARELSDLVKLSKNEKKFIKNLGLALSEGRANERKQFALSNSWEEKARDILGFINK